MADNHFFQKREERAYLDLLKKLLPEFPPGRIIQSESPDFIIQSAPRKKTGIELTRYTRSDFDFIDPAYHFKPELTKKSLIDVIQGKEDKISIYRKKRLNFYWLVILVDAFENPPSFNIHNQLESWNIDSTNDLVLLLDLGLEKVYIV